MNKEFLKNGSLLSVLPTLAALAMGISVQARADDSPSSVADIVSCQAQVVGFGIEGKLVKILSQEGDLLNEKYSKKSQMPEILQSYEVILEGVTFSADFVAELSPPTDGGVSYQLHDRTTQISKGKKLYSVSVSTGGITSEVIANKYLTSVDELAGREGNFDRVDLQLSLSDSKKKRQYSIVCGKRK